MIRLWKGICLTVMCSACSQIQPAPDFEETERLLQKTTGITTLYRPDEPPSDPQTLIRRTRDGLTLEEAVEIALLTNRHLQHEMLEIGVSHANLVQAGLLSNPVFSLLLKFPDSGGQSSIEAGIAQSISDLWRLPSRKRAARQELQATILRTARSAAEVVQAVRTAYYESLAAEELKKTAHKRAELARDIYRAVSVLREAGAVGILDENLASGELLRAELELQEAALQEREELRKLAGLLSLDIFAADLKGKLAPPEKELSTHCPGLQRNALLAAAREERLDLQALREAVAQAEAMVHVAEWGLLPDIAVGAVYERPEQASDEEEPAIDTLWGPELSVGLPLFDQNQAQIAVAHFKRAQAVKELEAAQLRLNTEIEEAIDRVQTARRALELYREKLLPQTEQNMRYARISYEAGESNLLTLLESQRALLEARRGATDALLQSRKALARLEMAAGAPLARVCREADPETSSNEE